MRENTIPKSTTGPDAPENSIPNTLKVNFSPLTNPTCSDNKEGSNRGKRKTDDGREVPYCYYLILIAEPANESLTNGHCSG